MERERWGSDSLKEGEENCEKDMMSEKEEEQRGGGGGGGGITSTRK